MKRMQNAKNYIFKTLSKYNPYVYHQATTGSIYIKFKSPYNWVGSIRIADHKGIPKYKYKWNLISGIKTKYTKFDRGTERFYYPTKQVKLMCKDIKDMLEFTRMFLLNKLKEASTSDVLLYEAILGERWESALILIDRDLSKLWNRISILKQIKEEIQNESQSTNRKQETENHSG